MKDFDSIYSEIINSPDIAEIEETRTTELANQKKAVVAVLIYAVIFMVLAMTNVMFAVILFPLTIVGLIIFAIYTSKKNKGNPPKPTYRSLYKDKIIEKFIKLYDEHLSYDKSSSIDIASYRIGEFEGFDRYSSDDLIYGDLNGKLYIQMGDVHTEERHTRTDSNGHTETYYTTVFRGLFSICNLPKETKSVIKIRTNAVKILSFGTNKGQVEMDSQEFEKYFDVYADDKILAMRLLTSDIMDLLINFKKDIGNFDFTIKNDLVCMRIPSSNLFEPHLSKSVFDRSILEEDYKYLYYMCRLCEMISEIIEQKDI